VSRAQRLERLSLETYDVLVVGAGITGAGVARDAALRGLKVALIDASDYGSGTSSRSSRLVHGGLRYLEGFEFGLVFEALRERARHRKLHPNLVWPIEFVVPAYKSGKHSLLKMDFGLWIYDLLSVGRTARWHKRLGASAVRRRAPGIQAEGLMGGIAYHDCKTDDARLTLANVMDAERHGATVVSYVHLDALEFHEGSVACAVTTDKLTGEELRVRMNHVVYAGGPWTDRLPEAPGSGSLMRPTKGVHLVLGRDQLPVESAVVLSAPTDGRVVFVVPDGPTVYVGTTDTDYGGDPTDVRASAEDVSYLLSTLATYFPDSEIGPEDVRGTWAGVRPLIASDADSAYATSREHEVFKDPRGLTTVAGGKLTTYRSMAEEVIDVVEETLPESLRRSLKACVTHTLPMDPDIGSEPSTETEEGRFEHHRWRLYGGGSAWLEDRCRTHPQEARKLDSALLYDLAEVSYAVLEEHAERLDDVLMRRMHVFTDAADQGTGCSLEVAEHMGRLLGKPAEWAPAEVARYEALIERSRLGAKALRGSGLSEGLGAS
jgi:glycerol-3-phosphate dehydrogenase